MGRNIQQNSLLTRPWRGRYKKLYGTMWFLLMYSILLYVGSRLFSVSGIFCESKKKWISFLIVGSIILVSSLLSRMFQNWLGEIKRSDTDKSN
jgi:hypothetical protein